MADYISREAVKEYLKRAIFGADSKIDKWVDAVPAADVVEVVRCKDCFYWSYGPDGTIWKCNMLSRDDYSVFTSENAYCYWGRWKEA